MVTWGGITGFVSLAISIFVLLRTLYLDRPHLWFTRKIDKVQSCFVSKMDPEAVGSVLGFVTLIVTNNSSRQNTINEWSASFTANDGRPHSLEMTESVLPELPTFNVTPVVIPAFSSVEAHLLFEVNTRTLPSPVIFKVKAKDRTRKVYRIEVEIPNDVHYPFTQGGRPKTTGDSH